MRPFKPMSTAEHVESLAGIVPFPFCATDAAELMSLSCCAKAVATSVGYESRLPKPISTLPPQKLAAAPWLTRLAKDAAATQACRVELGLPLKMTVVAGCPLSGWCTAHQPSVADNRSKAV